MNAPLGMVTLVGAGPGDPGLMTIAGLRALRRADIVIYDRLVASEILELTRSSAELIDAGKSSGAHRIEQEEINELIVQCARRGKRVVRLKGGDPFVFGRGSEEVAACREAGIACRVISGVTSAIAGPAAAGIPVTERRRARTVAFVTGRTAGDLNAEEEAARYRDIAQVDTIVILMSRGTLAESVGAIIAAGRAPGTPCAAIQSATTPQQRVVRATLGTIVHEVNRVGLEAPLLTVIGDVAEFADTAHSAPRGPLAGRRIMLTRPRSASRDMARWLRQAGADVVSCPLIRISYDVDTVPLDVALRKSGQFSWLVVTSQHTVTAIRKRLVALGQDARIFGGTRIAAIGPATVHALRRIGLRPDFVPTEHTGAALASELNAAHSLQGQEVCYPRADIAGSTLAEGLRSCGATVEDVTAYATLPCEPPMWAGAHLQRGVDAWVFSSPSAVKQFAALRLPAGNAKIACIGPTTARAAREAGLMVDVTAIEHHGAGLVAALVKYFAEGTQIS